MSAAVQPPANMMLIVAHGNSISPSGELKGRRQCAAGVGEDR